MLLHLLLQNLVSHNLCFPRSSAGHRMTRLDCLFLMNEAFDDLLTMLHMCLICLFLPSDSTMFRVARPLAIEPARLHICVRVCSLISIIYIMTQRTYAILCSLPEFSHIQRWSAQLCHIQNVLISNVKQWTYLSTFMSHAGNKICAWKAEIWCSRTFLVCMLCLKYVLECN